MKKQILSILLALAITNNAVCMNYAKKFANNRINDIKHFGKQTISLKRRDLATIPLVSAPLLTAFAADFPINSEEEPILGYPRKAGFSASYNRKLIPQIFNNYHKSWYGVSSVVTGLIYGGMKTLQLTTWSAQKICQNRAIKTNNSRYAQWSKFFDSTRQFLKDVSSSALGKSMLLTATIPTLTAPIRIWRNRKAFKNAIKNGEAVGLHNKETSIAFGKEIIAEIKTDADSKKQKLLLKSLLKSLIENNKYNLIKIPSSDVFFDLKILPIIKEINLKSIPKHLRTLNGKNNPWRDFIDRAIKTNHLHQEYGCIYDLVYTIFSVNRGFKTAFHLLNNSEIEQQSYEFIDTLITHIKFTFKNIDDMIEIENKNLLKYLFENRKMFSYTYKNEMIEAKIKNQIPTNGSMTFKFKLNSQTSYSFLQEMTNFGISITAKNEEDLKNIIKNTVKIFDMVKPIKEASTTTNTFVIQAINIAKPSDNKKSQESKTYIQIKVKKEDIALKLGESFYSHISKILNNEQALQKHNPIFNLVNPSNTNKQRFALSILLADPDKKHIRVKQSN